MTVESIVTVHIASSPSGNMDVWEPEIVWCYQAAVSCGWEPNFMTPLAITLAVKRHTFGEIKNCVPVRPHGKSIKVFKKEKLLYVVWKFVLCSFGSFAIHYLQRKTTIYFLYKLLYFTMQILSVSYLFKSFTLSLYCIYIYIYTLYI